MINWLIYNNARNGIVILWLLCLISEPLQGQVHKLTLQYSKEVRGDRVITDRLNNFYVIDGTVLTKYNAEGTKMYVYDNNAYGNIDVVDAFDPFKIMMYYPEFAQVIVLNDQLVEVNSVSLSSLYQGLPITMCATNENNYWIYDENLRRLRRMDKQGRITSEGTIMRSDSMFTLSRHLKLSDSETFIFMSDGSNHLARFDKFGNLLGTFAMSSTVRDFQVSGSSVYYLLHSSTIMTFDFNTLATDTITLPTEKNWIRFRKEKNLLFLLGEGMIYVYHITD